MVSAVRTFLEQRVMATVLSPPEQRIILRNVIRQERASEGVVLTGVAPVWLYLKVAHALHGKARRLL
jgi:hypothetical protein